MRRALLLLPVLLLLGCIGGGNETQQVQCADGRWVANLSECPEFTRYVCPDGTIVSRPEECANYCSLPSINLSLATKSHPRDYEMSTAYSRAMDYFNASSDDEALFLQTQLGANLAEGRISTEERSRISSAAALYRFVRDQVSLSQDRADFNSTHDDLRTLAEMRGRGDEKALLLRSLLTHANLTSKMEVPSSCAAGEQCACLARPDEVYVAVMLPELSKLEISENIYYNGSLTTCTVGDFVVLNPSCSGCMFAYGFNCSNMTFIPVLSG